MRTIGSTSVSRLAIAVACSRARSIVYAVGFAGVFVPSLAAAQDAAPAPDEAVAKSPSPSAPVASPSGQLQDIVVTAQKRSQRVQDAPLSVSAFNPAELERTGVRQLSDLQQVDSAVQIGTASTYITPFIRGIGNLNSATGNESSVSVYIDDVYYIRLFPPYLDLANLARVEVLKGPQGTLFGRNATGGVLSIYTRDPGADFTGEAMIGYGNYDTITGQLYVAAPISETLAIDFSASGSNQREGWGKNTTTGRDIYTQKYINLRSKLVWTPTDRTTVKLIGQYMSQDNEQSGPYSFYRGTTGGGADSVGTITIPVQTNTGFYDTQQDVTTRDRAEGWVGSLQARHETNFAELVSITSYEKSDDRYVVDGDNTQFSLRNYDLPQIGRTFSQEFQVKALPSSKLNWIVGLYHLNSRQGYVPADLSGNSFRTAGAELVSIDAQSRIKSYAIFGQATYPILPATNVTLGGRYTMDRLSTDIQTSTTLIAQIPVIGGTTLVSNFSDSAKFNKFTYKASVDHHFTDDIMTYASYSRGFKSGTYNLLGPPAPALKPEVVDAYEVGMKTELFDKRLRLNAAIFRNDITDPQVQSALNGLILLISAGSARSQGVELQATGLLAPGLTLDTGVTYLDAKYREFDNAPIYIQRPTGGNDVSSIDAAGFPLPRASKWRLTGGLTYQTELGTAGKITANANVAYSSRFYWNVDPGIFQKKMALVNTSLSFAPASFDRLTLTGWVRNLTDVQYYGGDLAQAGVSGFGATAAAPRTYGMDLRVSF
jgi:iron complex outermembrane receptor protein